VGEALEDWTQKNADLTQRAWAGDDPAFFELIGRDPRGVGSELELLLRAVMPVAASARITGKYSGRAPAITAFTATFSPVYSQYWRKCVERIRGPRSFARHPTS